MWVELYGNIRDDIIIQVTNEQNSNVLNVLRRYKELEIVIVTSVSLI